MEFLNNKALVLNKNDFSRKGSIDEKIIELVEFINDQESYVTTSSCSGRTSLFVNSELRKKGCNWLFISHGIVNADDVIQALENHSGSAILKFEPFVLHVQCSTVEAAQKLHSASIEAGFRNSGMSISKKGKIILAVRSTLSLESPLSCDGNVLVSSEYISFVVSKCNEKMEENWLRIGRLFSELKTISAHSKETTKVKLKIKNKNNKRGEREYEELSSEAEGSALCDMCFDGLDNLLNNSVVD